MDSKRSRSQRRWMEVWLFTACLDVGRGKALLRRVDSRCYDFLWCVSRVVHLKCFAEVDSRSYNFSCCVPLLGNGKCSMEVDP